MLDRKIKNKKVPLNLTVSESTKSDLQFLADILTDGNKSMLVKLLVDKYIQNNDFYK